MWLVLVGSCVGLHAERFAEFNTQQTQVVIPVIFTFENLFGSVIVFNSEVAFCQVCFLFGPFVLALFVLLFDIFVEWVARADFPSVVMSGASAWFVAQIVTVCPALGWFVVAPTIVAVLAVVIIRHSLAVIILLLMLSSVIFIFPQDFLVDAIQGFDVSDPFDDFIAIVSFWPSFLMNSNLVMPGIFL